MRPIPWHRVSGREELKARLFSDAPTSLSIRPGQTGGGKEDRVGAGPDPRLWPGGYVKGRRKKMRTVSTSVFARSGLRLPRLTN